MAIFKEKCWEILRKTRKPILAFWSIKFQPLGVERQMSPFWKEEKQGNNISHNKKKYFFDPNPLKAWKSRVYTVEPNVLTIYVT